MMITSDRLMTPWGPAEDCWDYGPGITDYSTAGHGGFHVTGNALERIPGELRASEFSPYGWFEEDVDAQIVVVCFPELFSEKSVWSAVKTLKQFRPVAGLWAEHHVAGLYGLSPGEWPSGAFE